MLVTNAKVSRDVLHNHDAGSILYNEGSPQVYEVSALELEVVYKTFFL